MKHLRNCTALLILLFLSVNTAISQACQNAPDATGDNSFLSECPWCLPVSPTQDGNAVSVPCYLNGVSSCTVTRTNFKYVLIFDDEFTGDAIDLDKWVTAAQSGTHGGLVGVQDYDNGENFQFNHPGVTLVDEAVTPFYGYAEDWLSCAPTCTVTPCASCPAPDGNPNGRYWSYTSSSLTSQYQFPLFNNTTYTIGGGTVYPYDYGIYQLTATLPPTQTYNGGPSPQPPYGSSMYSSPVVNGYIWPAFWMWNKVGGTYGEIDGFEFTKDASDDFQTSHYPTVQLNDCPSIYTGTFFGDGSQHNFYSMYTPDEIDWWVDATSTRLDTKFYGEDDPLIGDNSFFPICSPPINGNSVDDIYQNCIFPQNLPMYLEIGNGVQVGAQSQYFPVNFKIQSVKYWVPGNCTGPTDVVNADIDNSQNSAIFNAFTGTTVTIDGITGGAINIPNLRYPYHSLRPGNLEAIAINSIQIKGSFTNGGYMVLKADGNMCNEYTGPFPIDDANNPRRPIRNNNNDTSITHTYNSIKRVDSLKLQVRNSVTEKGYIYLNLTNISTTELNQTADVMVYDMLGQLLFNGRMQVVEGNTLPINLSTYTSGVYLVMVKTSDIMLQRKVILQK